MLTRDQLIDALHDDEGDVLDRTIDAHVRRLRSKLGDDAVSPLYIATVRGVGYRAAPIQLDSAPVSHPSASTSQP